MEFVVERLCRYFHAGQVIQLVSPGRSVFAEVLACGPGRVTARAEGSLPEAARALVRAPVKGALFQASASLRPVSAPERTVMLEDFANVQCTERRAVTRLAEPIPTHIFRDGDREGFHRIAAVNVGADGLLLGWPGTPDVALGERVRLELTLETGKAAVVGRVVRVDSCRSAIQFLEISAEDQDRIAGHVFRREVIA